MLLQIQVLKELTVTSAIHDMDKDSILAPVEEPITLQIKEPEKDVPYINVHIQKQGAGGNYGDSSVLNWEHSNIGSSISSRHNFQSMQQLMPILSPSTSSCCDFLQETEVQGVFSDKPIIVKFCPAPIKTMARMREKLAEYATGVWPFCCYILDPVRCSIVCDNPTEIVDVVCQTLSDLELLHSIDCLYFHILNPPLCI